MPPFHPSWKQIKIKLNVLQEISSAKRRKQTQKEGKYGPRLPNKSLTGGNVTEMIIITFEGIFSRLCPHGQELKS